jgi:FtsH-binding integral membrane protein
MAMQDRESLDRSHALTFARLVRIFAYTALILTLALVYGAGWQLDVPEEEADVSDYLLKTALPLLLLAAAASLGALLSLRRLWERDLTQATRYLTGTASLGLAIVPLCLWRPLDEARVTAALIASACCFCSISALAALRSLRRFIASR